jgi:hypothetical protein
MHTFYRANLQKYRNFQIPKREFQSAIASYVKEGAPRILPILLDDSEVPKLLTDLKYWKYNGGTERDRGEIVSSVTGKSPSQNLFDF